MIKLINNKKEKNEESWKSSRVVTVRLCWHHVTDGQGGFLTKPCCCYSSKYKHIYRFHIAYSFEEQLSSVFSTIQYYLLHNMNKTSFMKLKGMDVGDQFES